jgi:class 3 adenylate cyclase
LGFTDSSMSVDWLLDHAVDAINIGDRATADALAGQVLAVDRGNQEAEDLLTAPARYGEIRRLTIMFVDLVGSTALSTRLESEAYHTLVGRYRDEVRRVVDRYEGHISSIKGDGLLAVFGHPTAHEDDVRRAVAAGLDITRVVAQLSEQAERKFGVGINVRVGIHRGLVYLDTDQDDVYGFAANLAARLCRVAEPGTVAVSGAVAPLMGDSFELDKRPPVSVKGVDGLIVHYRAVNERERDLATPGVETLNSPGESLMLKGLIEEAQLNISDAWARAISTYGVFGMTRLSEMSMADLGETERRLLQQVRSRELLSLAVRGVDALLPVWLFPAFQFDKNGNVLPVMSAIASRVPNWDMETKLLWLTSPNGWLAKQTPAELLAEKPEAVMRALDLAMSAA